MGESVHQAVSASAVVLPEHTLVRPGEPCAQRCEGGGGMYWKATEDPCIFHLGNGVANIGQVLGYRNTIFLEELIM